MFFSTAHFEPRDPSSFEYVSVVEHITTQMPSLYPDRGSTVWSQLDMFFVFHDDLADQDDIDAIRQDEIAADPPGYRIVDHRMITLRNNNTMVVRGMPMAEVVAIHNAYSLDGNRPVFQ